MSQNVAYAVYYSDADGSVVTFGKKEQHNASSRVW
jgi:hypothetical protein